MGGAAGLRGGHPARARLSVKAAYRRIQALKALGQLEAGGLPSSWIFHCRPYLNLLSDKCRW